MNDYPFRVLDLPKAYRHQATRAAYLHPLVFGGQLQTVDGTKDAVADAVSQWRGLLRRLRKAGWAVLASDDKAKAQKVYQYLRNCPPAGVLTAERAYVCKLVPLCPFCWARTAYKAFCRLERALYGIKVAVDREGFRKRPPAGVRLFSFRTTQTAYDRTGVEADWMAKLALTFGSRQARGVRTAGNRPVYQAGYMREWFGRLRRTEYGLLKGDAGYAAARWFPVRDRFGDTVSVVRGGLVLTRTPPHPAVYQAALGAEDVVGAAPEEWDDLFQLRDHGEPTKEALYAGVRHALLYPAQLLAAPAEQVVEILHALATGPKTRLAAGYGPKTQKAFFELVGGDPAALDDEEDDDG